MITMYVVLLCVHLPMSRIVNLSPICVILIIIFLTNSCYLAI